MRVVIIDDSTSALEVHAGMLAGIPGCEVVTFSNSGQGLQWCLANAADLIVVDYAMPPPDGLHFLEHFRAHPRGAEVPVVMVTSCGENDVRRLALRLGATDFLSKPVDEVEFVSRVRNLLKMYQSHMALSDRAHWLSREVRKATHALVEREREAILILSRAAEFRDPETAQHLVRMATYCRIIADGMGLPAETGELLLASAPMHDIGKIGIPDHILLKPGRLDARETELMRRHAEFGAAILAGGAAPLIRTAAIIARSHHERFDGTGYPDGLAGTAIPQEGRIAALADVFDALTSDRPYKRAWSLAEARAYVVERRGLDFDPDCVDALLARWPAVCETATAYRDSTPSAADEVMAEARTALFGG